MLEGLSQYRKSRVKPLPPPARIIALGGYRDCWHAAISSRSPYGPQEICIQKEFPREFVKERWKKGMQITGVAGDSGTWAVLMSEYKDGTRPSQ